MRCVGGVFVCMVVRGVIVRRRAAGFVTAEGDAKLGSDRGHGVRGYGQREDRHQKQTRSSQALPPDSKNVLGCRLALSEYHGPALFGRLVSRPGSFQ